MASIRTGHTVMKMFAFISLINSDKLYEVAYTKGAAIRALFIHGGYKPADWTVFSVDLQVC